jgi:hypothetical protein
MILRSIVLVPTWLLVMMAKPFFPPTHPWKGKRITLWNWAMFATPISVAFGVGMWLLTINSALAIWGLTHRRVLGGTVLAEANACFILWFLSKLKKAGL